MIPYGKQDITQADIDAVTQVLNSNWLTQGPKVPEFEQAVAQKCKAQFAVATHNATSALHIACLALEVQANDSVWTSPISFVASANCARYCGAKIDFIDIDLTTGNISVHALQQKLAQAKQEGCLPKVIIVVHLAGLSCDMAAIGKLAQIYQFKIIEDASHAIGAWYQNNPVGYCQYSDICIFSFHPVKIITTAEGGLALTNQVTLAKKMQRLRSHGITSTLEEMTEASHGPWYYQQLELGFNYRMTELQAALGLSQLERLEQVIEKRNQLANYYTQAFEKTSLSLLTPPQDTLSAYHLYIVLLPDANSQKHKQAIIQLRAQGICAHVHYIPIHLQPYYQQLGFKQGDFPAAENYYQRAISLPLYPQLNLTEQNYIIDEVKKVL